VSTWILNGDLGPTVLRGSTDTIRNLFHSLSVRHKSSTYDAAKSLYSHPKRWGEQATHLMGSGLNVEAEKGHLDALKAHKDKVCACRVSCSYQ